VPPQPAYSKASASRPERSRSPSKTTPEESSTGSSKNPAATGGSFAGSSVNGAAAVVKTRRAVESAASP
jgi:hypothetical protein